MSEKLKPCPFCGGTAAIQGITIVWVKCLKCGVETAGYRDEEDAIDVWNRRVGDAE